MQSLTITILRQMSIIPMLSLILKNIFVITGIWITFVIAESIAAIVAVTLYKNTKLKL
ncbi:MAG: hypothetical protein LUF02_06725 [Erysipelotrichaceae bacterium]|nr:hypothetical protein [Erysipelotrichaceae bacterium]